MAHRRALVRPRSPAWWALAPLALLLDAASALLFAGYRTPLGLVVPEAALFLAPFLVYGALAFVVFRRDPVPVRLAAMSALLAIHAGLVLLHWLGYARLWGLPAAAAFHLTHRWSPLVPLFQLVWVPLLAAPLVGLVQPPALPASRRRQDVPVPRVAPAGSRAQTVEASAEPPARPAALPPAVELAVAVAPIAVAPDPMPSVPDLVVAPTLTETTTRLVDRVVDELDDIPIAAPAPAPIALAPVALEIELPSEPEPLLAVPVALVEPAPAISVAEEPRPETARPLPEPVGSIDTVVVLSQRPAAPERLRPEPVAVSAPVPPPPPALPAAPPMLPPAPLPTEPPVDPYVVARLFEPYGSLLSRAGAVLVDWMPGPHAAIVCAAPRELSRERLVELADRLAPVLAVGSDGAGPVRRLTLRGPEGVAVFTPLEGGILVAGARRPGALGLLEVLSARVVPGPRGSGDAPVPPAPVESLASAAVRIETPVARLDVLAPAGVAAASVGELVGALLAAIAGESREPVAHTIGVDLGAHRLVVEAVHPDARPPRFVAVVGGAEPPGLLGRRTERTVRALREVS